MSLTIDLHALQTLPPSLINRDDTGAPKSAIFGGVPRQRVSSQSWKRAIRRYFQDNLDPASVGYRTRRVADLIVDEMKKQSDDPQWTEEACVGAVKELFKKAGIKLVDPPASAEEGEEAPQKKRPESSYLLFLSPRQIANAAAALVAGEKLTKKVAQGLLNQEHSVDIAMFGRMVADDANFNVDASVQVAHALGIHESEPEFDYFTAVDDVVEKNHDTGAGMIGTVQMMSSTLYRFATIDVDSLVENLGDENAAQVAIEHFIEAFIKSMPTGKQNSFANNTLPELVYVTVQGDRSVSLVNAFEEPITGSRDTGRRAEGAQRLAQEAAAIQKTYGIVPRAAFVLGLGELPSYFMDLAESVTMADLGSRVVEVVRG